MMLKGSYKLKNGKQTEFNRLVDPVNTCLNCGEPAILGKKICHDCACEDMADYIPTPDEIAAGTAEIRKSWDESQHRTRAGVSQTDYVAPTCRVVTEHRIGRLI